MAASSLRHPAVHADQLRMMREAAENSLKGCKDEAERREIARKLDIEAWLPDPQQRLPLSKPAT